ncbi:hypothetical protein C8035_v002344 [Colletotrichum spinosum]|uniref:Uncharacterized protein n=1 Tax=Colletotrichum spinosum TaxID=1347390 RepID=A0A4R8PYU1_9PEZI|nr:hypothetical protein C8035_v002344 [Colletotrichum spinosum]
MPELFMPCEVFQAYKNSSKHGPKAVPFPPEEYGDRTSHSWVAFQNEVEGLAVHGLYGCTSIVVVSRRGAWACHIWQPTFDVDSLEDKETFRREAYQHIHWGSNDKFAEYGLEELRDNIGVGSSRNLFGDSSNSAVELGTQVFIMTPRPPLPFEYPDGDFLPYEAVDDAYGNVGLIRYEEGIDMIWEDMVKTFGDVPIEVVDYAPRLALSDQDQDHVRSALSDENFESSRGKLLLQYRPAGSKCDKAAWRLWVENAEVGTRTAEWEPTVDQIYRSEHVREDWLKRAMECWRFSLQSGGWISPICWA